jgi:hypothetical protein
LKYCFLEGRKSPKKKISGYSLFHENGGKS